MKKFPLHSFFNLIIATFIFFFLTLIFFLGYFKYNVSLTLSITFSLLFALIYFCVSKKRFNTKKLKKSEAKSIDELMIELNFISKKNLYSTFSKAFNEKNKPNVKVNRGLYLKEEKTLIFFSFSFEGVSKADVLKAYNMLKKEDKCLIYSSFCSPETEKFIERFGGVIKLESKKNIYNLLKETSLLPKYTHILLDENNKANIKNIFIKKNAKRFLSFGIILVLMSFFVYYQLYYLIFGIVFLILSSASLLFGKEN